MPLAVVAAEPRVVVAERLLYQYRPAQVCRLLEEQFGVSRSTAMRDISEARDSLAADAAAERPAIRAMATQQLKAIASEARAEGDYGPAVSAWREIGRLHGAYEPDKITVVPSEEVVELRAILHALSPAGQAALDVLLEDIARAQSQGLLPAAAPELIDADSAATPDQDPRGL